MLIFLTNTTAQQIKAINKPNVQSNSNTSSPHRGYKDIDICDEEWNESEHQNAILLVLFSIQFFTDSSRKPKWVHDQIVWENHGQGSTI